jgi:DNA-binding MarR family transcriptional regulator
LDNRIFGDPGTDAFQVKKYPFFLLNRLIGRYNGIIEARLRTIGLDIPFWRVLLILGEQAPQGIRDVADAAIIPLSTMTRIIQRMTQADFVQCEPNAEDARVTMVSLSPLGMEKLAEARAATSPVYKAVIQDISPREFDRLVDLLERLQVNLDGF